MNMNLTLITSIVLTAGMASVGTYYLTTGNYQPSESPAEAVVTAQQTEEVVSPPVTVAMNKNSDKSTEITVRTEVVHKEKHKKRYNHVAAGIAARNKPQPSLQILN